MRIDRHDATLGTPIRLRQDFSRSRIDRERSLRGNGDRARYLMFAGTSRDSDGRMTVRPRCGAPLRRGAEPSPARRAGFTGSR